MTSKRTRELKFRAWNIDKKEWAYLIISNGQAMQVSHIDGKHEDWNQYTGLKDRNGKEIYEGDIVKAKLMRTDNHDYVYAVEYVTYPYPMFAVNGRQMNDDEYCVIGNIYQSPELIKESNDN